MAVNINSNVAALNALRRLGVSSSTLSRAYERLSSGLRINRPSDDAAGLAIASDLNLSARVFNRGLQNANDGIGMLNVAEGSLTELSSVLVRIRELASQAANGTLSNSQRKSLNSEAQSLRSEFNRIVGSAQFNGLNIHSANQDATRIQMGFGSNGGIGFTLGDELARTRSAGSHDSTADGTAAKDGTGQVAAGDYDRDGRADVFSIQNGNTVLSWTKGGGDGTISGGSSIAAPAALHSLALGDVDNDGNLDAVVGAANGRAYIYTGDGNGNFNLKNTYTLSAGNTINDIKLVDLNNDGKLDLAAAYTSGAFGYGGVAYGDGSTFGTATHFSTGGLTTATQIDAGDFNNDGLLDVALVSGASNNIHVHLNTGGAATPSFGAGSLFAGILTGQDLAVGDFNNDGFDDFAVAVGNQVQLRINSQSGSFRNTGTVNTSAVISDIAVTDLNGDGLDDVVVTGNSNTTSFLSQEDETLQQLARSNNGLASSNMALADMNGDGVLDLVLGGATLAVHLMDTEQDTTLAGFNLLNQTNARASFSLIDAAMERLSDELGVIGAAMSRISSGIGALRQAEEDYRSSESRIMDADVADESATLLKSQILQQAGSAILGQANQQPALALLLLNFGSGRAGRRR